MLPDFGRTLQVQRSFHRVQGRRNGLTGDGLRNACVAVFEKMAGKNANNLLIASNNAARDQFPGPCQRGG